MKKILGISAFYHDSAAALSIGGKIVAAAQEERFNRIKNSEVFPLESIRYCLEHAGLALNDLDAIVFYDKPILKFERLLETYYAFAPKGIISFLTSMPVWLNEKLFLKKLIRKNLEDLEMGDTKKIKLLFSEHHLSHAAAVFYTSSFETSAILTIDGVGEWSTASMAFGDRNKITILKELQFPHSIGLLYSAFTYFLGFKVNSGEYKVMGLAPYGNRNNQSTKEFIFRIKDKLVSINEDGSIWMDQSFYNYSTGLKMINTRKWENLLGLKKRQEEEELTQEHCNLALAIQIVLEEIVLKMATEIKRLTGSDNLCISGGVALNCVANSKILKSRIFKNIYIQPAPGDAGASIGAALAASAMYFNENITKSGPGADSVYLGPDYSLREIESVLKHKKAAFTLYEKEAELSQFIASRLSEGNIVGCFRGRMEFGPRALGNRSILASPSMQGMQEKLNLKIKNREGFRPFAPSVLAADAKQYFDIDITSPFMLFTADLNEKFRKPLPEDFDSMAMDKKLSATRSEFQAAVHVDYSARIQTVDKTLNEPFYNLLEDFKKLSGHGILLNTSMNVRGEPLVCSPEDAYNCFMNTEMDYLIIENFLLVKTEQADYTNKKTWQKTFKKD